MTNAFRLFTEEEGAKFAGISVDTLRQYERYGLLSPVKRGSDAFYKESDLKLLFAVSGKADSSRTAESPKSSPVAASEPVMSEALPETTTLQSSESAAPEPTPSEAVATAQVEAANEGEKESAADNSRAVSHAEVVDDQPAKKTEEASTSRAPYSPDHYRSESYSEHSSPGVFELLEVNKSLRDQIQILKEEREWLRTRVEKLETRGERDQMLVIAENETVKTLLARESQQPKRRSIWTLALPWLKEQ